MARRNTYTPAEFADRIGKHNSTVWRWLQSKRCDQVLKMYDAEVVTVAGKRFIRIVK